ncbi:MAG: glycoside hydrolase family 11 protein [Limisphaerales bacterium]
MKLKYHFTTGLLLASLLALVNSTQQANAGGTTGYSKGYYYFTYYTGNGATSITPNGANYSAYWPSGLSDSLAGVGYDPGSIMTIGYNYGYIAGSFNSGGAYGWAPYPNLEWYITDFGSVANSHYIGSLNSDGGTYNVYEGQQGGGPQYLSSRTSSQSQGQNHTITMANHVNYWKAHIGSFGTIRETVIMVECWNGGSGSCNGTIW